MKITKYEHACLVIEEQGKQLVIDPGAFTTSLPELTNVCAIIVTHAHADHFDLEQLDKIQAKNPEAKIYSVREVTEQLENRPHEVVSENSSELCGVFHVSFFGKQHAIIHESLPKFQNVGVMVNDTLYYPGDSFTLPHVPVKLLATPISGPWLKMSEVMDFVTAAKPEQLFATHNAILSDVGMSVSDRYLPLAGEKVGAKYLPLKPGDSLEI